MWENGGEDERLEKGKSGIVFLGAADVHENRRKYPNFVKPERGGENCKRGENVNGSRPQQTWSGLSQKRTEH